jgi:hypothetical protein
MMHKITTAPHTRLNAAADLPFTTPYTTLITTHITQPPERHRRGSNSNENTHVDTVSTFKR